MNNQIAEPEWFLVICVVVYVYIGNDFVNL